MVSEGDPQAGLTEVLDRLERLERILTSSAAAGGGGSMSAQRHLGPLDHLLQGKRELRLREVRLDESTEFVPSVQAVGNVGRHA